MNRVVIDKGIIVDNETGEVFCDDLTPKFQDLNFEDYRSTFKKDKSIRFIQPMKAEELVGEKLDCVISNPFTIAEQKWDGHRGIMYINDYANRVFSRNISKQTNWYSENSDQLPHIRDTIRESLDLTVIDGEITLPIKNCCCRDVQSVTGSLPSRAIDVQKEKGFAIFNAFDILYYKGLNVQHFPLWKRKLFLVKIIKELNVPFIKMCKIYVTKDNWISIQKLYKQYERFPNSLELINEYVELVEQYSNLYRRMIVNGDEGIILKDICSRYEQKVSKSFVKMKEHNTYDCLISGYDEPVREYSGITDLDDWLYWEDSNGKIYTNGAPKGIECEPVTKIYAMGWIGAIRIAVLKKFAIKPFIVANRDKWKLKLKRLEQDNKVILGEDSNYYEVVEIGTCSGLDDNTRAMLTEDSEKFMLSVIEVEAQKIISKETGSLQHPRFKFFRPDKNKFECTFEAHIREYKEGK